MSRSRICLVTLSVVLLHSSGCSNSTSSEATSSTLTLDLPIVSRQPGLPSFRPAGGRFRAEGLAYSAEMVGELLRLSGHSATVDVQTRAIRRGESGSGAIRSVELRSGIIEIERIEALERYQAMPEGLEQSWRFAREPEGEGDLVVEVALPVTLRLSASDDRGLELVDDVSGMILRYGHGVWIDARGERVEIKSQWAGDHVELTVPESVVLASTFPAVLDPLISAPFRLGEPVFHPAAVRGPARVLGGGGKFLAAWTYPDGTAAARVRASDGLLLDPGGIALLIGSVFGCPDLQPAVGYDAASDVFLVAYTENAAAQRIVATLIRGSDGTIINPTPIEVSAGPDCGATLARGAGHYLVSWRGYTTAHIQSRRLQFDGTLVGPPVEVSANPAASYGTVTSAYAAGRFLVSWTEGVNIRAQRINEVNGALLGSSLGLTSGTNGHVFPSASADGHDFVVAWVEPGAGMASVRARSPPAERAPSRLQRLWRPTPWATGSTSLGAPKPTTTG